MLSDQPGSRFEVELPGEWPACPRCGSSTRIAAATQRARSIEFACGGNPGHKLSWTDAQGRRHRSIDPDLFGTGARFAGLLPYHFLTRRSRPRSARRYDCGERRKDWIRNEQAACAGCGTPPLKDWSDGGSLLDWLRDRDGAEAADVRDIIAARRLSRADWFAHVARHHIDLAARIYFRVADSYLAPEPGIPVEVLAALWPTWSASMRKVATNTLAFGVCRRCSWGQRFSSASRDELLRRHCELNHAGSRAAAQADRATWLPLLRVIQSIAEYARVDDYRADLGRRVNAR